MLDRSRQTQHANFQRLPADERRNRNSVKLDRRRPRALLLAALAALACVAPSNAIRVAPNATADSLAFVVTAADSVRPATLVYGLTVVRCGSEDALWTISADGTRQLPSRVVYGQRIEGFPTRTGPAPLTPGCYEVIISGGRPQRFEIGVDHTIRVAPRP